MMRELSLNILDISENSVKAGAKNIYISVSAGEEIEIVIKDDGCGMTEETLKMVTDPYYTTRTTRKVGMGLPLFKMEAEMCGGRFGIDSEPGKGTTVTATFKTDSIDRPPLGDIAETVVSIAAGLGESINLVFHYSAFGSEFTFDTKEIREELGGIGLDEPEIVIFLREMIKENIKTENGGVSL